MAERDTDDAAIEALRERINGASSPPERVNADKPFALRPGVLRNESTLTVKTNLAQKLVFGRPPGNRPQSKRAVVGLVGFAKLLKPIHDAAERDDPYADQRLLEIEAVFEHSFEELGEVRAKVEELLTSRSDVQHHLADSIKPIQVPLYFSNQFAFRAAYLINDLDIIVCAVQTARFVALLTVKRANNLIRHSNKVVRRALTSANGYHNVGVSRADILHRTAKGCAAVKRWGELPLDILNGSRRALFGPPLPENSFASKFPREAKAPVKRARGERRRKRKGASP